MSTVHKHALAVPARTISVEEAAGARLRQGGYLGLRRICCRWHNGTLTLSGTVGSYYLKLLAQERVQGLDGVVVIDNRLEVVRAQEEGGEPCSC
jgi:hypothetical protein